MKMSRRAKLAYSLAICMLVLGLTGLNVLLSVQAVALDMDFYMSTWTELDIPGSAGMSLDDLRLTGERLLGYFVGSEATPQVTAVVEGAHRPVFREHEIEHLRDVRHLFRLGFRAKRVCWAMVLTGVLLAGWQSGVPGHHEQRDKRRYLYSLSLGLGDLISRSLKVAGLVLVAATVLLSVPALLDFTRWWTGFHLITFDNDLWRLDPRSDWLIKIFPEEFFSAAVTRIGLYSAAVTAAYIVIGMLLRFSISNISPDYGKYNF
ncbi:MAG: DUF1461 domain-containing protein [Bacillota bacterium]|nr:DUF1461 domain-containing protein [Candidatus Fermentithermobacillaceae bacterium]